MRLLKSAVLVTMAHTSGRQIPLALAIEGTQYHKLTFDQSGHTNGPPGPWSITRCAIVAHSVAATEQGKVNIQNFVEQFCTPPLRLEGDAVAIQNIAKYPNKTPAEITARMVHLEAANVRVRITQEIQVFRVRTCRGNTRYSNFQCATSCVLPIATNFFSSLLAVLSTLAAGELRYGMTPPSSCERSLKKLLADMGDSYDGGNY